MSNKKGVKVEPTPDVLVLDASQYYNTISNRRNVGFSLSYGVRNHSRQTIQVRSKAGYSHLIEPVKNEADNEMDYLLEKEGVWLDVRLKSGDITRCERYGTMTGNRIDREIDKYINRYIGAERVKVKKNELGASKMQVVNFSICLSDIAPNFGSMSYYSDTLGVIIDTETTDNYKEFLAEVHQEFTTLQGGNENSTFFEMKDAVYCFAYLVDNTNELREVWCMQNGVPTKVPGRVNHNLQSGLYIFSQEERREKTPYSFYPIDTLDELTLTGIGFALSRREMVEKTQTKEVADLKRSEASLMKLLQTHAQEIEYLKRENGRLKEELEDEKYNTRLEQRKYAEERLNVASEKRNVAEEKRNVIEERRKGEEAIRTATDKLTTEIKHLKEDLREEKLNVKNEQRKVADEKRNVIEERRKAEEEKRIAVEQLTTKVRHLEEDLRDEKRKTADEKRKRENDKEKVNKNKTADILATVNSIGGLLKLAVGLFKCIPKFA